MGCGYSTSVETVSAGQKRTENCTRGAQYVSVTVANPVKSVGFTEQHDVETISKRDGRTPNRDERPSSELKIVPGMVSESTWSLDDNHDDDDDDDDVHDVVTDAKSIVTSRTVLTTQSAFSQRTRSTHLERSAYDLNGNQELFCSPPQSSQAGTAEQKVQELADQMQSVLTQLPVRPLAVYEGNHFWWPAKRVLLPNYRQVQVIDKTVEEVSSYNDAKDLVQQLSRHCEEEVEVARVLYRWVALNIEFQPQLSEAQPSPRRVLQKRRANAMGISSLYKHLCSQANLNCEVLEGLCKHVNYFPGMYNLEELCTAKASLYHSWNKVQLGRRWHLVDVSLSQHVCKTCHEASSSPIQLTEELFMAKPQDFVSTHLPMRKEDEVLELDLENQLIPDSGVSDLQDWEAMATRTAAAHEWGVKPLSHQYGVITTDENEVWLQFMCPNVMEYHVGLECPERGLQYEGFALIYLQEDVVTAYIRLPGPGTYVSRLFAAPAYPKAGAEGLACKMVMMYTLKASGAVQHLPFSSSFDGLWGLTPRLFDAGCRVLSTKGSEITAIDGRVCVDLRLPVAGIFPNLVWFCRAREENVNLDGFVYAEREGRLARLHLLCPQPGEYILLFQAPVESHTGDPGGEHSAAYARFFITCQSPATTSEATPSFPYFEHCLCGPLESIAKYGLSLDDLQGSTLYSTSGACHFRLRQERPVAVTHTLEGEGGVVHRWAARWVFAERNGYDVVYHVRISEPGRFKITLLAAEYAAVDASPAVDDAEEGNDRDQSGGQDVADDPEVVCVLMVDNTDAHVAELYPEYSTIWGVGPLFHQLGLCSPMEEYSQLTVEQGLATLEVQAPRDVTILPKLYHTNDSIMDMTEYRVVCRKDTKLTFLVTLPFKGNYHLKLSHNDRHVASFLLACTMPAKPAVPYEPFWTEYGPTEAFESNGLKELDDDDDGSSSSSPVREIIDGQCLIRHSAPKGLPVHLSLVGHGQELPGCVYGERLSNEVAYHVEVQEAGYYRLVCWSRYEDSKRDRLLFSYLLRSSGWCPTAEPYPEYPHVWGLNTQGFACGVSVRSHPSSTIKAFAGTANLLLSYPNDLHLDYSLEHAELAMEDARKCLFVEQQTSTLRCVSISLPSAGRYALKLWAQREQEDQPQCVGAFLVTAMDSEGSLQSYPTFNSFYEGCRLVEPMINPLSAKTEYFFQLEVPGAKRLQLWDGIGQWRASLEPVEDSQVFSGMINVGEAKELWIAGMYDPEYRHGNGGFRNLLMYDVV